MTTTTTASPDELAWQVRVRLTRLVCWIAEEHAAHRVDPHDLLHTVVSRLITVIDEIDPVTPNHPS
jgi:hypothetical protein